MAAVRLVMCLALTSQLAWASYEEAFPGIDQIWGSACGQKNPPAGFNGGGYELLYGIFLMPLRALGSRLRLLEIGLGCDMSYGPGASAVLKRAMLPEAHMWEAELDGACVQKHTQELRQLKITPLVGDQGNRTVLDGWVATIGGQLDVIIDDGAHTNTAILASFNALWPRLANGGLYFLEDLNVGRLARWDPTGGEYVMADILQAWQEQLVVFRGWGGANNAATRRANEVKRKHPLPCGVKFIYCQEAACVIGKETIRNRNRHPYRSGVQCSHKPETNRGHCPFYAPPEAEGSPSRNSAGRGQSVGNLNRRVGGRSAAVG
jgi:hypothetical protein